MRCGPGPITLCEPLRSVPTTEVCVYHRGLCCAKKDCGSASRLWKHSRSRQKGPVRFRKIAVITRSAPNPCGSRTKKWLSRLSFQNEAPKNGHNGYVSPTALRTLSRSSIIHGGAPFTKQRQSNPRTATSRVLHSPSARLNSSFVRYQGS